MRKFLIGLGITAVGLLLVLYLGFLFVLPNVLKTDNYKNEIVNIVKDKTGFDISYDNSRIQTTPLLSVWLELNNLEIKDKKNNEILSLPKFKARVSLPSIFLVTLKISAIEIDSPKINLNVSDGVQLDILKQVENIVNKNKENQLNNKEKEAFDFSFIRIKIVNARVFNYDIHVNDLANKHYLSLKGESLKADYFNGDSFKVKTQAHVLFDGAEKISSDIKLDCFIPKKIELDSEDDPAENFEISSINPVEIYRKFDLKTNISANLKIRNKKHGLWVKGPLNIENLSLRLSDYILPESYIKANFNGFKAFIDTNINLAKDKKISLLGNVRYTNNPKIDLKISTDELYLNNLIKITKSVLDTFNIKNDLKNLEAKGYILADVDIKTNFKKIKSKGRFLAKDGEIISKITKKVLAKINADILFDDENLKINNISTKVGGSVLGAKGDINDFSDVNIKLNTDDLPLSELFNIFAPPSVKKLFYVQGGKIFIDLVLKGKLKDVALSGKLGVKGLNFIKKDKSIVIKNDNLNLKIDGNLKKFNSLFENSNFSILMPSVSSNVTINNVKINIDENDINILPFSVKINSKSSIDFEGYLKNYFKKPTIYFVGNGLLNVADLKRFLGKIAEPFISSQGSIPIDMQFNMEKNRGDFNLSLLSDESNYITPVIFENLIGQKTALKTHIILKPNRLNIRDTGLYLRKTVQDENGDLKEESEKIVGISGTINNTNSTPFINLIKIDIPNNLKFSVVNFKNSVLNFGGGLKIYGDINSPSFKGEFNLSDISLPDVLTDIKNIKLLFNNKNLNISASEIMVNGSDMKLNSDISLQPLSVINVDSFDFLSVNMNLDKLLNALDLLMKKIPQKSSASSGKNTSNIPVLLKNGSFNIYKLSIGNIIAKSIRGKISLRNNILSVDNLNLSVFEGLVSGAINMDLISSKVLLGLRGSGINTGVALEDSANITNAIYGTTSFDTNLTLLATPGYNDLIKSLNGDVNFKIENGQFGGFAKFENFILAENIRESQFFQTALGSIINSIATIDTTHFEELNGRIVFDKGILHILPINSKGNVITFNITGDMDILANEVDMKLRGRLASAVSNLLGPLSAINPINIVKNTPGLNVVLAKTFSIFCQSVTQEELNEIPEFNSSQTTSDATNFQIVLNGSLNKPLTLVKSFKWLALQSDLDAATGFVELLPEPEVINSNGKVLETKEEIDKYNSKTSTKIKKFIKKVFKK